MNQNYFDFFGLTVQFQLDEKELRALYFENSRKHHPDLHMNDEQAYQKALELSGVNNDGYKVLKNFESRLGHILEINGISDEKSQIPPDFLMEMMEFNEELMEVKINENEEKLSKIKSKFLVIQNSVDELMQKKTEEWDKSFSNIILKEIKILQLKQKYLNRIKDSVSS